MFFSDLGMGLSAALGIHVTFLCAMHHTVQQRFFWRSMPAQLTMIFMLMGIVPAVLLLAGLTGSVSPAFALALMIFGGKAD